jgi:hypothetical protein
MPVSFLTDDQTRRYGRFVDDLTSNQLARHFHLDDADRPFVAEHRGDHNRLGVAIRLGSVRLLGGFLHDPAMAHCQTASNSFQATGVRPWRWTE